MSNVNKGLADLLRWSIENTPVPEKPSSPTTTSAETPKDGATTTTAIRAIEAPPPALAASADSTEGQGQPIRPPRSVNADVLSAIFGGPSEADLMRAAIEIITDDDDNVTLENRLIAFDNLEQLVESLDNANNLEVLGLWTPLLGCLASPVPDMRRMASWCVGTAVQNNLRTQERLLAMGGIPPLVSLALHDGDEKDPTVRKKAQYALSCAIRNYQPAMNQCSHEMKKRGIDTGDIDATDMDAVDDVLKLLRG